MGSQASAKYRDSTERARLLRLGASGRVPAGRQAFYHASLAAGVAAWQAYVIDTLTTFYSLTKDPAQPKYAALHQLARQGGELAVKRFNTPNWENARDLLLRQTGYDPAPDWTWTRRNRSAFWVKERLNQVLQVRHSFAHGHAIPVYPWTRDPQGRVRLTVSGLRENDALFAMLVRQTDRGLARFLGTVYGISVSW